MDKIDLINVSLQHLFQSLLLIFIFTISFTIN